MSAPSSPLLEVEGLRTTFHTPRGQVRAVDGVSFALAPGETLGIVGESGSGKSVLVRTVMGLIDAVPTASVSGRVAFDGVDLRSLAAGERRAYWGTRIAMVFQDPTTSLNPVKTVKRHLVEHVRLHLGLGRRDAVERAASLLGDVGIPDPRRVLDRYPHELSGGQCQRICIALALACRPQLLIADEPTTALDVTVQQQILELLDGITADTGMATLFITHDLALVNRHCERVVVMYGGRLAESSDVRTLYRSSRHPYTRALLRSAPRLDQPPHIRLATIEGRPPDLVAVGPGCPFAPRCPEATSICSTTTPSLDDLAVVGSSEPHLVACHHPLPVAVPGPVTPAIGDAPVEVAP